MKDNPLRPVIDLYMDYCHGPGVDLLIVSAGGRSLNTIKRALARSAILAWSWEVGEDGVIFRVKLGMARRVRFSLLRLGVTVRPWGGEDEPPSSIN